MNFFFLFIHISKFIPIHFPFSSGPPYQINHAMAFFFRPKGIRAELFYPFRRHFFREKKTGRGQGQVTKIQPKIKSIISGCSWQKLVRSSKGNQLTNFCPPFTRPEQCSGSRLYLSDSLLYTKYSLLGHFHKSQNIRDQLKIRFDKKLYYEVLLK